MSKKPVESSTRSSKPENLPTAVAESEEFDEIREEIERTISPVLTRGQREQVTERVITVLQRQEAFRGPIAHPRHLEQYERIVPGAADRIIRMAEKEQDARISAMQKFQEDETQDKRQGMNYGLIAFLALVVGAGICGYLNQPWLGAAFLAAGAISAVGIFVNGRRGNGEG